MDTFGEIESALFERGIVLLAGVDEVGRGPLAGPVVAAAVVFPTGCRIDGIGDSKTLTEAERKARNVEIRHSALAVGIGSASPEEIDEINILQASILAMHRAVLELHPAPDFLLVDGNRFRHESLPFQTVVKGDSRCFSIGAASIVAKVHRDALMVEYDALYPEYGFAKHKGYPTQQHVEAIRVHGLSPMHRRSFSVRKLSDR